MSRYTTEADLSRTIQLDLSHGGTRLFRQHVGVFWAGTVVNRVGGNITLANAYAVHVGTAGMSDLYGLTDGGIFVSLEVKNPGARTDPGRLADQIRWCALIASLGGRSGIVDNLEAARKVVHP